LAEKRKAGEEVRKENANAIAKTSTPLLIRTGFDSI